MQNFYSCTTQLTCSMKCILLFNVKASKLEGPADVYVSEKKMFDCYFCIKSFFAGEIWKRGFEKFNFSIIYILRKIKKRQFKSKDLRHPDVNELCSLLCTILLMTPIL